MADATRVAPRITRNFAVTKVIDLIDETFFGFRAKNRRGTVYRLRGRDPVEFNEKSSVNGTVSSDKHCQILRGSFVKISS